VQTNTIAWALGLFFTGRDGKRSGRVITHDFDPEPGPGTSGHRGGQWVTLWEDEYEALGAECMCDSLGDPDGPDGLYVFECVGASFDPGDGWTTDPSSEIEGEWRPLHIVEWTQIVEDPNLEAFCAMTPEGQRIEWDH